MKIIIGLIVIFVSLMSMIPNYIGYYCSLVYK